MANEAVLMIETELPISMTCADGVGIEKGCFLKLTDPYTASAHSADEDYCAGIAAEEKIASDGKTKIAVYRRGIFKVTASGGIPVGNNVALSNVANKVKLADATCSGSKSIGTSFELVATDETFLMELNIGGNTN